jgi:hypothetical protein
MPTVRYDRIDNFDMLVQVPPSLNKNGSFIIRPEMSIG